MAKIGKKILILALISLFLFLPFVKAQNAPNSYFENVRNQLLSSVNSQIVSHSAIILGLIVAIGTIGKDAVKAITSKKLWKHVLAFGSIAFIVLLSLYESGRIFYYTDISSRLITLNNASLNGAGIQINSSNEINFMSQINQYATTYPKGNLSLPSHFAQWLSPNNPLPIPILIVVWILSIFASFIIYSIVTTRSGERRISPQLISPFIIIIWTISFFTQYLVCTRKPQLFVLVLVWIAIWMFSLYLSFFVKRQIARA